MTKQVTESGMKKTRDTYKYQFKVGNKIVHGGITNDLGRREAEHLQTWPSGHIKQVGRRTTVEDAQEWERDQVHSVYGHARKHTRSKKLQVIFRS